jgi:hypothetical protein
MGFSHSKLRILEYSRVVAKIFNSHDPQTKGHKFGLDSNRTAASILGSDTGRYAVEFTVVGLNPDIYAACYNNGTSTTTDTGINISGFSGLAVIQMTSSSVTFYLTQTVYITITTNIPTSAIYPIIAANASANNCQIILAYG